MNEDPKNPPGHTELEEALASPTELAGTTEGAINAEFAARDAIEARDAEDAATENTLPLDGE